MASSGDPGAPTQVEALRTLGRLLSLTEARLIAAGLAAGESITSALAPLSPSTKDAVHSLIGNSGLRSEPERLLAALYGIQGARSDERSIDLFWTMPGHLARSSALTTSLVDMVAGARVSVVCSTYNFQRTSGMWHALRDAAQRPGVAVRLYVDTSATNGQSGPTAQDIADHVAPAEVFRTAEIDGVLARNHAKFLVVDHRVSVITSANFSWSAEYRNVELGVRVDDSALAERIEAELRSAEGDVFERLISGVGNPS